jgi:hypothetical protein
MNNSIKERRMEPCACVIFTRSTGKVRKCLDTQCGYAMLESYAYQSITGAQDAIIFFKKDGKVIKYIEGHKDRCPEVYKEDLGYADDYCPGLLAAVNEA